MVAQARCGQCAGIQHASAVTPPVACAARALRVRWHLRLREQAAPVVGRGFHQGARPALHQGMQAATAGDGGGGLAQARACLGHALAGQGVAAQVGEASAVVEPAGLVQPLEHRGHARCGEPGVAEDAVSDAIGFPLHVAREVQLALDHGRLASRDGGLRRVGVAAACGDQHAQQHGRHAQGALAAGAAHAARNVALAHVGELVSQHGGQFVARGGHRHQAQVHTHVPPRQGEGVHAAILHQEDLPGEGLVQLGTDVAPLACRLQ